MLSVPFIRFSGELCNARVCEYVFFITRFVYVETIFQLLLYFFYRVVDLFWQNLRNFQSICLIHDEFVYWKSINYILTNLLYARKLFHTQHEYLSLFHIPSNILMRIRFWCMYINIQFRSYIARKLRRQNSRRSSGTRWCSSLPSFLKNFIKLSFLRRLYHLTEGCSHCGALHLRVIDYIIFRKSTQLIYYIFSNCQSWT